MKQVHKNIHKMDRTELGQAAYDRLVALLHKVSLSEVSEVMDMNLPTLYRCLDDNLPIESISKLTACYMIFMIETNPIVLNILGRAPRPTAYYAHERHARIAKRTENKNVASH